MQFNVGEFVIQYENIVSWSTHHFESTVVKRHLLSLCKDLNKGDVPYNELNGVTGTWARLNPEIGTGHQRILKLEIDMQRLRNIMVGSIVDISFIGKSYDKDFYGRIIGEVSDNALTTLAVFNEWCDIDAMITHVIAWDKIISISIFDSGKKSDNSISAHIAEARKSVNERPDWMKSVAHFSEPRIENKY